MAEEARVVLFEVKIDTAESQKNLKDLNKELDEGKKKKEEQSKAVKTLSEVLKQEATTIAELRKQNSELNKIRNSANIATDEGRKQLKLANDALDKNNQAIKANVDQYTRQKIGIGDYSGALSQFFPMVGKVTTGIKGMDVGLKTLAANPVGAILTALVLTIQLISGSLQKFEPVMDAIENATKGLTDAFNGLLDGLNLLGSALGLFFSGNFSAGVDMMGEFADNIEETVKEGQRLLELTRELEDATFKFRVATATANNEMKALVTASKNVNLSYEEREALLKKASDLENQVTAEAVALAEKSYDIKLRTLLNEKRQQVEINGLRKEAGETENAYLQRLVDSGVFAGEAIEEVIGAYEELKQAESEGLAFQEKIFNDQAKNREKYEAEQKKALDAQNKLIEQKIKLYEDANKAEADYEAQRTTRIQRELDLNHQLLLAFQQRMEAQENLRQQEIANAKNSIDILIEDIEAEEVIYSEQEQKELERATRRAKKRLELEKLTEDGKIAIAQTALGQASALLKKGSTEQKALAVGQAIISTYQGANKAIATYPPPLSFIFAGLTIAQGLKNVQAILKTDEKGGGTPAFAKGGLTGKRISSGDGIPVYRSNGDNLLATVRTGEVILNERQQAMLGGEATFRRLGIAGFAGGGKIPAFAEGGLAGFTTTINNANDSSSIERLLKQPKSQPVLIMEDWEYKYGEIVENRESARIL